MYRTINFSLPARRSAAAVGAAVALAAGAVALAPGATATTPATSGAGGSSTATVLRAGLDVSLLNKTVDLPLDLSLNDVKAPADAKETALTVKVGSGVEKGHEVDILRADVATADATADRYKAEGYVNVAKARIHVPGLPLLALVKVDAISSKATCQVGHKPTASSQVAGVTILGRRISLSAVGTTRVDVPGVGEVGLDLTSTRITSRTAAATALQLKIHINPLSLGVAEVTGDITLAKATCRTPQAGGSTGGTTGGSTSGGGSNGGSNGGSSNGGSTNGGSSSGGSGSGGSTSGSSGGGSTGGSTTHGSTSGSTNGSTSGASGSGGSSGSSGGTAGTSGTSGTSGSGSGSGGTRTNTQTGTQTGTDTVNTGNLAETGAGSSTPYMAIGAVGLLGAGAGAFLLTNRRRKASLQGK